MPKKKTVSKTKTKNKPASAKTSSSKSTIKGRPNKPASKITNKSGSSASRPEKSEEININRPGRNNSAGFLGGSMQEKILPIMTVLLIGAAFAVGLLYGKVSVYEQGGAPTAGQPTAEAPGQQPVAPEVVELSDDQWESLLVDPVAVMGDEDAPVAIVEFSSYQCPFCAQFHENTFNQLVDQYINEGIVKYIPRDLPLVDFQFNSRPAALAARCAGDQGSYFEMQKAIYESQSSWSQLSDPAESFEGMASDLGLNAGTFSSCLANETHGDAVDADLALAGSVGASGTPTFFINGTKLVGAQPLTAFEAAIEKAMN